MGGRAVHDSVQAPQVKHASYASAQGPFMLTSRRFLPPGRFIRMPLGKRFHQRLFEGRQSTLVIEKEPHATSKWPRNRRVINAS